MPLIDVYIYTPDVTDVLQQNLLIRRGLCSSPGDLIRSDQNPLRIRSDNLPAKFHILGQVV